MNALNRTVVAPLSSAIIAVLLAGLIVVGVDSQTRKLRPGEARLQTSGIVEISVAGSAFTRESKDRILNHGDRVRVLEGGASLELPDSATAELRTGSIVTIGAGAPSALLLEAGDLLVEAPKKTLLVDGGTAEVSVAGAAKLRRAASLAVGVYRGNVLLDSQKDESSLTVPTYRQAVAAGTGLLPANPEPLELRAADAWDARMLPEVLHTTQVLESMGRDFEGKLSADLAQGPELFRALVPALGDAPVSGELLVGRAPAENLIGLVLVSLDKGDFPSRVKRIFGFRSEGASWGLVAADRNLNPNPIIRNLESAVGALSASPVAVSPELQKLLGGIVSNRGVTRGPGTPVGIGLPPGPGGTTPRPTGPGTGTNPTTPPGGGSDPPSTDPTQPPSNPPKRVDAPPTGSLLDPVVDPLEDLLSGLLDGLLGTTTQTPGASTPVVSPVTTTTTTTTTTIPTTGTTGGGLVGGVLTGVGGLLGG